MGPIPAKGLHPMPSLFIQPLNLQKAIWKPLLPPRLLRAWVTLISSQMEAGATKGSSMTRPLRSTMARLYPGKTPTKMSSAVQSGHTVPLMATLLRWSSRNPCPHRTFPINSQRRPPRTRHRKNLIRPRHLALRLKQPHQPSQSQRMSLVSTSLCYIRTLCQPAQKIRLRLQPLLRLLLFPLSDHPHQLSLILRLC